MHLTHNENIKTLEYAMRHLELEEDRLMASKTSTNARKVESGTNENIKVGINKRVKEMLRERENKSLTNLEKERRKASSRK